MIYANSTELRLIIAKKIPGLRKLDRGVFNHLASCLERHDAVLVLCDNGALQLFAGPKRKPWKTGFRDIIDLLISLNNEDQRRADGYRLMVLEEEGDALALIAEIYRKSAPAQRPALQLIRNKSFHDFDERSVIPADRVQRERSMRIMSNMVEEDLLDELEAIL